MKRIILLNFIITIAVLAKGQYVKSQTFKVDTTQGHGYEVIFIGQPYNKKSFIKTENGVKPSVIELFRPSEYSWREAMSKMDSINNLSGDWSLPTTRQLKTIFEISQSNLEKKRIYAGNPEYQGIDGGFWCYNGCLIKDPIIKLIAMGKTISGKEFLVGEGWENNPAKQGKPDEVEIIPDRFQLLFIRKY